MKLLSLLLFAVLLLPVLSGCENSDGQSTEEIDRQVERELDRTRDRVDEVSDRLNAEELEKAREDFEHSLASGIGRIGSALEKVGQALEEASDVQPVNWRELDALLPEDLDRFELGAETRGETNGLFGLRFSKVEATYLDGRDELELIVIDLGSLQGLAEEGISQLNEEYNRGKADGFERTDRFGGFPGYEMMEHKDGRDHMMGVVVIDNRFVVVAETEGRELDADVIEDVLDDFPLRRLGRLTQ